MASAKFTKTQGQGVEDVQIKPVDLFRWTPEFFHFGVDKHVYTLGSLVERVKDAASGASLVFELSGSRDSEMERFGSSYLNANQISRLQRLALCALNQLEVEAEEIALSLSDLARGEK